MRRQRGDGRGRSLRRLRSALVGIVVLYALAGTASQRLVPGINEVFPFFGWSLFSRVPSEIRSYTIVLRAHDGRELQPPVRFEDAPEAMVRGSRSVARKLIHRLGEAIDEGRKPRRVRRLRRLLEANVLVGRVEYELVFESFDPLEKWKTGKSAEVRTVATFRSRSSRD